MNRLKYVACLLLSALSFACSSEQKNKNEEAKPAPKSQLNLTILLDLSDRIAPGKQADGVASQVENDMTIVNYLADYFRSRIAEDGVYNAEGKIRVRLTPMPSDPKINEYLDNLIIDLKQKPNESYDDLIARRQDIYTNIHQRFSTNLKKLYDLTLQSHSGDDPKTDQWAGADLYRFFKDDAKNECIDTDPVYRNILVVLTDGYIYHKSNQKQSGHRYTYITPTLLQNLGLRSGDILGKMQQMDFGLLAPHKDLKDLEVIFMEINPSKEHLDDWDILKSVLGNWVKEMGADSINGGENILKSTNWASTESKLQKLLDSSPAFAQ